MYGVAVHQTARRAQGNRSKHMDISVQGLVSSALLTSYPPLFCRLCLIIRRYAYVLRMEILCSALKLLGVVHPVESSSWNLHCLLTGALSHTPFFTLWDFLQTMSLARAHPPPRGATSKLICPSNRSAVFLIKPHVRVTAIIEHLPASWLMF